LKDNSTFAIENASAELPVASSVFSRYFAVALVCLIRLLLSVYLIYFSFYMSLSFLFARLVLNFSWLLGDVL
jgi:hypothetical protein